MSASLPPLASVSGNSRHHCRTNRLVGCCQNISYGTRLAMSSVSDFLKGESSLMRKPISLILAAFLSPLTILAQSPGVEPGAIKPVQEAQSIADTTTPVKLARRELRIPAGTTLEIETAYTVLSSNVRQYDFLSFRVLVPIKVDGLTLIEKDALVT